MTTGRPLSRRTLGAVELASRPCGTNAMDVSKHLSINLDRAGDRLRSLAHRTKELVTVYGRRNRGVIVFIQYFKHPEHAQAWEALSETQRPNLGVKPMISQSQASSRPLELGTWKKLGVGPITQRPPPQRTETVGIALGYDPRFQLGPKEAKTHVGPFGSLKIGQYLTEKR